MFVVGFVAEVGVDVGVVGVAAAAHGHIRHGPAGGFSDDGVRGVGGDALRGVHGDGVAQVDMLTQVVAFEDDAGLVGEPFGGDAVGRRRRRRRRASGCRCGPAQARGLHRVRRLVGFARRCGG